MSVEVNVFEGCVVPERMVHSFLSKYVFRGFATAQCVENYRKAGIMVEPGWKYGSLDFGEANGIPFVSITENGYTYAVEPKSVGQWSGLYDESTPPNRIFDGDIIKISYTDDYLERCRKDGFNIEEPVRYDTISYEPDVAAFCFYYTVRWLCDLLRADHLKLEVVGALFDNEEITKLENYHGKRL